jgi:hypothetical protein
MRKAYARTARQFDTWAVERDVYPTTAARVESILRGEGFKLAGARGVFGPIWLSPLVVMSFVRK